MDPEFLAELREEALDYMVHTATVQDAFVSGDVGTPSASNGNGGPLMAGDPGTPGTSISSREYQVRVTVPTSHNQKEENTQNDTSDTLTKVLLVFPWDAVVLHTSNVHVVFADGRPDSDYQVTQVELDSEQITLHAYATKIGV